jgi:Family of unknown function (DUF5357)
VQSITDFLLNLVLVKNLLPFFQQQWQNLQERVKKITPFSWESTLLLSALSWSVYLLVQGYYFKKFVSVFGWLFLIVGVDWALLNKTVQIPLIGFKFKQGPWITGAITCIALLSNDFILRDWRSALISWPIFSAVFAGYTRFLQPGLQLRVPDAGGRQELVLLFLVAGLLSSWFQFHFLIQNLLQTYPNLLTEDMSRSAFVVRLSNRSNDRNDNQLLSKAYPLLDAAEAVVRESLAGKNWLEAQNWLRTIDSNEPSETALNLTQPALQKVYGNQLPREQQLWQIAANTSFSPSRVDLLLIANWLGPTAQPGNTVQRLCMLSEVVNPNPQTFNDLQQGSTFEMRCQPSRVVSYPT